MDRPLVAVVLAGGGGTRLYPASRPGRPKQFLALGGEQSLLARTVERAGFADEIYVLTGDRHADAVRSDVPSAAALVEPAAMDTGPAAVYAAHRIREQVGECVLCMLPADHHVAGDFAETVGTAARVAVDTGGLVTIGVEPTRPATGYGYIRRGERRDGYHAVDAFVEKPDVETATRYVQTGSLWNAGIFAWTPTAFLEAARDGPLGAVVAACEHGTPARGYDRVEPVSVDRAVLERAENVFVVPAGFEWDDLGTWEAVWRTADRTAAGNAHLGDTLAIDAERCVLATDEHVAAVGVSDLVVASFDGRTLVVPRDKAERVREVSERVGENESGE